LKIENKCKIFKSDALNYLKKTNEKYHIIFADPPYYQYNFIDFIELVSPILYNNGIFCFESDIKKIDIKYTTKVKKIGSTQITFWRKNNEKSNLSR